MAWRIVNHDYAGHPFQVQLSRSLARRGHDVLHLYSAANPTPHGALERTPEDPAGFSVQGLSLDEPFEKWSYLKRRRQEIGYGRLVSESIAVFRPDIVLSGNTPTHVQRLLEPAARKLGARFVFWVQDVYSLAVHKILRRKLPLAGELIGRYYMALERRLLRASDAVVLIAEEFEALMQAWGVPEDRTFVIHNWAPLEQVPQCPVDNPWSRKFGLHDTINLIYSGTLAMKHNPDLLLQLALHFRGNPQVRVVVISEGPGPDWLREKAAEHGLENLLLLPWQPMAELPQVLGAAQVLLAVLEPEAGVFSVPSKVLTYLCAGRPLLLAVPLENLAAKIVQRHEAGILVTPDDTRGFVAGALRLLEGPELRASMARNARQYAETHFDLEAITDRFEEVFRSDGASGV